LAQIAHAFRAIRDRSYDAVVDTQGLLRTGIMTKVARGTRHGYDATSVRERLSLPFYDTRHAVAGGLHAVERNRVLTGLALGYAPQGAPDFGLARARLKTAGPDYAVLLHATARPEKEWPAANWIALGRSIAARGMEITLPWGTERERSRAEEIAAALPGTQVPERAPLDSVARLIAGAQCVVGVDTGLLHLAAALGVPLVAIFAGSKPHLTGPVGSGPLAVLGAQGAPPSVKEVDEALQQIGGG
jgi:heptosyltransferase-1